ncbi:MAG: S-methyl-5-thioribose-1-phosphate isomerase [Oligoflexia bacterium]|nr:S-methyl-5-thioribose-1-phosphate isomerase [Oligoflexia bacterium]
MQVIKTLAFKFRPAKDLLLLDQTLLPKKKAFIPIENPKHITRAIKALKVRGANLIGVTAGFSLAQYAFKNPKAKNLKSLAKQLSLARPTAVHLSQAVQKVMKQKSPSAKLNQAIALYEEDKKACESMAKKARPLIKTGDGILTYCNTGCLATAGIGTALGAIKQAFQDKKQIHVFVCETRPLNQGSRLTFWELNQEKIPCSLICDNMTAHLMSQKKIQKVFVGADRISKNGDTANKIGTYNLAVISHHFKIPFYVVAPSNTIDSQSQTGQKIPIEQRAGKEISSYWAKHKTNIINPSFDVTPRHLITKIITEKGYYIDRI